MTAPQILSELRTRLGKTQSDVARDLGLPKSLISMYEAGLRNPSDANKKKLADYYGSSVSHIFFADDVTN